MHLAVRKRTAMPFAYSKLPMTDEVAFNPNALVEHAHIWLVIYGKDCRNIIDNICYVN